MSTLRDMDCRLIVSCGSNVVFDGPPQRLPLPVPTDHTARLRSRSGIWRTGTLTVSDDRWATFTSDDAMSVFPVTH